MPLEMYQVDAFTQKLFAGNPAAIVIDNVGLEVSVMQRIAAENNLAETAFLRLGEEVVAIRWFTPTVEVDLCGHATLAAAHVLYEHHGFMCNSILFSSKRGELKVYREAPYLYLDFPADSLQSVRVLALISQALGIEPLESYRGIDDYLVILESESDVAALNPDMMLLKQLDSRGLIVSARGKSCDFVSRFFAPQSGIEEDSVTGSAHTSLIPYWAEKLGKKELQARQISKRGGVLRCRDRGERVHIGGEAITFFTTQIFL